MPAPEGSFDEIQTSLAANPTMIGASKSFISEEQQPLPQLMSGVDHGLGVSINAHETLPCG